jgi:hypothetical protein
VSVVCCQVEGKLRADYSSRVVLLSGVSVTAQTPKAKPWPDGLRLRVVVVGA